MDEFPVAKIDSYMGSLRRSLIRSFPAPEDKVSRLQGAPVGFSGIIEQPHISTYPTLLGRVPWQQDSVGEKDAAGQSAAIYVLDGSASP